MVQLICASPNELKNGLHLNRKSRQVSIQYTLFISEHIMSIYLIYCMAVEPYIFPKNN